MKWSNYWMKAAALCGTLALATACQQDCNCPETIRDTRLTREAEDARPVRQRLVGLVSKEMKQLPTVNRFVYSPAMLEEGKGPLPLDLLSDEVIEERDEAYANVEAAELVTSIFNALIAAETSANLLDVNLSFSEEAVDNGMFVFAIDSPKEQELHFTMYDEEAFEMAASNTLSLTEGENYRAVNLSTLDAGSYVVKLKNTKEDKELMRRIRIADPEK